MFFDMLKTAMPSADRALPGRDTKMAVPERHAVLGSLLSGPWPKMSEIQVGMGCFWGAERKFWTVEGVICTAVGYGAEQPRAFAVCAETGQARPGHVIHQSHRPAPELCAGLLAPRTTRLSGHH